MTDPDRASAAETSGEAIPARAVEPALPAETAAAPTEPAAKPKKEGTDWWGEIKAIFWLVLAVLGFHSFIAKPFYIPSESMMPGLLVGDRLVVSKYPYGWSWVSPSFHILPHWQGRLWGALPERGDVVIVTPPSGPNAGQDYIKRVIGLPGDTLEVIAGTIYLNGQPVRREERPDALIPVDQNAPCEPSFGSSSVRGTDGRLYCRYQIVRETLPNGRSYDTIESGNTGTDNFARITIPEGHVFLMGDNRDHSADSRVPIEQMGLGGPVPWENIGGRAEFITFSLDGSSSYWNPISWFTALRGGRSGTSLRPDEAPPGNGQ